MINLVIVPEQDVSNLVDCASHVLVLDLAFYVIAEKISSTLDIISLQNRDHSGIWAVCMHTLACDAFADALSGVFWLKMASHDLRDDELALWNVEVVFFHVQRLSY